MRIANVTAMGTVEVSEVIQAPSERVWDLIRDPTRMADLTSECTGMKWTGRVTAPEVGARFRGTNRRGWRRWSTTCTIVRYQPGREIAWDVRVGPVPVAEWSYRIVGAGDNGAVTVTERFVDHRSSGFQSLSPLVRGVKDTEALNRQNIVETLARLKTRAEA
jgi:uncharacterized protein YndB with AHSA1/START domain